MREVDINGKKFEVRGLRRKERCAHGLDRYGYGRFFYSIPETADGKLDREAAETGLDIVLDLILGADAVEEIDSLAGMSGLAAAHMAIIKETYGARDEEKNSPPSGAGPQTETA